MIADWGVEGGGVIMSTLYYTTVLDFLHTQHMTYFENS